MPYIILAIGAIIGGIALYRFFLKATPQEVKAALLSICALGIGIASLFLAVTGRLPAAIAILVALWPLAKSFINNKKSKENLGSTLNISEKEAYEILGLDPSATREDIHSAHLRLMKKVHPDQDGSDWLAKKINAAKDLLLKSRV